jgi:hypothetical protein
LLADLHTFGFAEIITHQLPHDRNRRRSRAGPEYRWFQSSLFPIVMSVSNHRAYDGLVVSNFDW